MAPKLDTEDIELGEREDDAFLPSSSSSSSGSETIKDSNFITRRIPPEVRKFIENVQRIKLVFFLLAVFLFLLAWVALSSIRVPAVSIPEENVVARQKVLKELEGSAIPDYVLNYAPLVYLDKGDEYYPSDILHHVKKTHPTLNFTKIKDHDLPEHLNLDNLDKLNDLGGLDVFLSSKKDLFKLPKFLKGTKPSSKTLQTHNAKTCAVIVVEKEDGIVDAFYMYFYTFNAGPQALGHTAGNHLGDWEHNAIRFRDGKPESVWYSQHEYGAAYTYSAVTKAGIRPLGYSAKGSHANYVQYGAHDLHEQEERIPSHLAYDHTSRGPLWDPTLSAYFYTFSPSPNSTFTPVLKDTPVNWLYFQGHWGDPEYGDEVKGQEIFHGFHKWIGGPRGPLDKNLDRKEICWPSAKKTCKILDKL